MIYIRVYEITMISNDHVPLRAGESITPSPSLVEYVTLADRVLPRISSLSLLV